MSEKRLSPASRFSRKLRISIVGVVIGLTFALFYIAEVALRSEFYFDVERDFEGELDAIRKTESVRTAVLLDRARSILRKPRILAAIEDDAVDLLYANANDEFKGMLDEDANFSGVSLRAYFYRFLDGDGRVIKPNDGALAGLLPDFSEDFLKPNGSSIPDLAQIGFREMEIAGEDTMVMLILVPVISRETGKSIASLVLGFSATPLTRAGRDSGLRNAWWVNERITHQGFSHAAHSVLQKFVTEQLAHPMVASIAPTQLRVDDRDWVSVVKFLNPGSIFPPCYEIFLYPLDELKERTHAVRLRVASIGAAMLLAGLGGAHLMVRSLADPVKLIEVESERSKEARIRAEVELESKADELNRVARFSSDVSHQLRTPLAVLRAGLEHLQVAELKPEERSVEVKGLLRQASRISNLVEDMLLLARMETGRLKLDLLEINLSAILDSWIDDLSVLDDPLELKLETDYAPNIFILGDSRYIPIVIDNLIDNARKYNRPGGLLRVRLSVQEGVVMLGVFNQGKPIPPDLRSKIFERFHRGSLGENIPGTGLGLNLAREICRLHGGYLKLASSDTGGTEFQASFRSAFDTRLVPS